MRIALRSTCSRAARQTRRYPPASSSSKRSSTTARGFPVEAIGWPFTDALLDGPFFESVAAPAALPVMSVVFVQSVDGNTEVDDPSALGGGETDKHVIYEGLSRVSADAVMAGANSVRHGTVVFSVWHPELGTRPPSRDLVIRKRHRRA